MTTIYVVTGIYEGEGWTGHVVAGVFSSEKLAEAALSKLPTQTRVDGGRLTPVHYSAEGFTLDDNEEPLL